MNRFLPHDGLPFPAAGNILVLMPDRSPAVHEPARRVPVCHEADLCVVGGSCTGLFAAIRAARLGLSVAVVEQQSILGGMAAAAQVNEWHSTWDASGGRRVIGGLTLELVERLRRRGAVEEPRPIHRAEFRFNSAELAAELDDLALGHRIRVFLAARCVAAAKDDAGRLEGAVIEDRSGRRAIRARAFVDASGDGSLLSAAGLPLSRPGTLQPVNLQAIVSGLEGVTDAERLAALQDAIATGYPAANGAPWPFTVPGAPSLRNLFGARLHGLDASDADDHTRALQEGRRLHRAFLAALRSRRPAGSPGPAPALVAWAHTLGVRQTRHAISLHRLSGEDLLAGRAFPDAIAQGTYPVDIHTPRGVVLRYLDGREERVSRGGDARWGRWRDASAPTPACYTIPYRSLLPRGARNLAVAGRLLDADPEAFGGARVMVNLNQTGEAAGVAAALALRDGAEFARVDPNRLRDALNAGGSLLLPLCST